MDIVGPQTNPDGMSVITVRVIKSFEFRTSKNLIIKADLSQTTVGNLKEACRELIKTKPGFKPYRNVTLDTLKIYTHAFGHKTQNLIINLEDDGFLEDDSAMLDFVGIKNETELSIFEKKLYDEYKANPEMNW
ncbi:hypothetical protein LPJ53_000517 [Coemansia erecta]|uniref:Cytoplasmic protein n=1 Tax=Coemansia erecta TaxID=147472 RepID=A0A9W8CT38_9FUNG|nr:hypothetical protein LPJ53_000517 [Coemansia erecta]